MRIYLLTIFLLLACLSISGCKISASSLESGLFRGVHLKTASSLLYVNSIDSCFNWPFILFLSLGIFVLTPLVADLAVERKEVQKICLDDLVNYC